MLICVKVNIIIYKFKSFFHNCMNGNFHSIFKSLLCNMKQFFKHPEFI